MKLIVGLGNSGKKYKENRHNVGFLILDEFACKKGLVWSENKKVFAHVAKTEDYVFVKPTTLMNLSGHCVSKALSYFKVSFDDLIVVHDDVDLEFGKTILKKNSGSAGHHGVEDIISKIGSKDFWRYRVGIGRPKDDCIDVADWVLSDFSPEELKEVKNIPFAIS